MSFAIWISIVGALLIAVALFGTVLKRLGLLGAPIRKDQRLLLSWFGIRGIGSIYYLMFVVNHGVPRELAEYLLALTLTVVTASILLHGISVTPLMNAYTRRNKR